MALQSSGQISLNDIHVEAGGSSGSLAAINDSDIRDLIDKSSGAQMSFSEWYGAAAFSGSSIADVLSINTNRNYIETVNKGNAKRDPVNQSNATFSLDGNGVELTASYVYGSLAWRYQTSQAVSCAWGTIPSVWAEASGSTIIFYSHGISTNAATNAFHTDSGGTQRSLSLTGYSSSGLTVGDLNIDMFSSNSSDYNLSGCTIGATLNKSSSNTHNGLRIWGIPGRYTHVADGVASTSADSTVSCQADDLVILFSTATGQNDSYHQYQTTTNLTRQGAQNIGRWGHNSNMSIWKCTSSSFTLRGSSSDQAANVHYFVIRYAG